MGISVVSSVINKRNLTRSFGLLAISLGLMASSSSLSAQNMTIDRLEKGEVVSAKMGSSFLVQALVKKDQAQVTKNLFETSDKISQFFPNVAFARPFKTKDGRQLLYLKLRGAGDGLGVMLEAKQGSAGLFTNARELLKSGDRSKDRAIAQEELNQVGDNGVGVQIQNRNEKGQAQRLLGSESVVVFEGPLNPIPQMPTLRVSLAIALAPYTIVPAAKGVAGAPSPASKDYTLLQFRVAFGSQVPKGEDLGDYKGFGERRLELAKMAGANIMTALKARLEKF